MGGRRGISSRSRIWTGCSCAVVSGPPRSQLRCFAAPGGGAIRDLGRPCVANVAVAVIPAILLMGPTASGKSALALELAQRLGGEIVSVDSAQVYRGMDIGTAKPDAATRARVPHHLIDIVDPSEAYSAARFAQDAANAIAEVRARKHVPIVASGTMLYFKALIEGLSQLPQASPSIRAA